MKAIIKEEKLNESDAEEMAVVEAGPLAKQNWRMSWAGPMGS